MKKLLFVAVAAGVATLSFAQESVPKSEQGWRISVGGAHLTGIKSSLSLDPAPVVRLLPNVELRKGASLKDAASVNDNITPDGVIVFDNGFINPMDDAGIPGETVNWRIDNAADFSSSGTLSFRNEFSESSGFHEERHNLSGSSDEDTTGIRIDVARTIFRREKFGVDLSMAFSWYDDVECLNAAGKVYNRNAQLKGGYAEHSYSAPYFVGEPDLVNPDGSIGAGTMGGPGPILTYGSTADLISGFNTVVNNTGTKVLDSTDLFMSANGEYSRRDFSLALEPYYMVSKELSLRARLGMAVVCSELSTDATATVRGQEIWRRSESFDETSICLLLGAELNWDFCNNLFLTMGVDSYLGLDDLDVKSDFLHGKIEQGALELRAAVGMRF